MGLDIHPGSSSRSSIPPVYSVIILRDDVVLAEYDKIPLYTVIRLILEYHVDVLAVDNVYEIARDSRSLTRISRLIPYWCRIVEVTNRGDRYISVEEIARELGLEYTHLSPNTTARIVAYAALRGYGREVRFSSDRTYIVVSKGRTPVQGGSSSSRYKRSIRASVLQVVREVKSILDENKVDYDLVVKESDGGLEKGFFVVYAPIDRIKGLIPLGSSKNVKVSIRPALQLKTMRESKKIVILGIDPGMSVGIAVLDLDGNPLLVHSFKNPDRESIIEKVLELGKPIIVAVDVAKPPDYAKKIATILNAQLYSPEEDMNVDEKQKLVREYESRYGIETPDTHSRDALASALKALKYIKPKIEEIESKIKGIIGVSRDEILVEVLKGKALSEVLENIFKRKLTVSKHEVFTDRDSSIDEKKTQNEEISRLRAKISELENLVKKLQEQLDKREEVIENLELELKILRKKPPSEECERRIQQLQVEIGNLRNIISEKTNTVESLKNRLLELEKVLIDVALGKNTVTCRKMKIDECNGLPVFVEDPGDISRVIDYVKQYKTCIVIPRGLKTIDVKGIKIPIIEGSVVFDMGDYVVVSGDLSREIEYLWREIEESEARDRRDRILKMIREYQESRKKRD